MPPTGKCQRPSSAIRRLHVRIYAPNIETKFMPGRATCRSILIHRSRLVLQTGRPCFAGCARTEGALLRRPRVVAHDDMVVFPSWPWLVAWQQWRVSVGFDRQVQHHVNGDWLARLNWQSDPAQSTSPSDGICHREQALLVTQASVFQVSLSYELISFDPATSRQRLDMRPLTHDALPTV